MASFPLSNSKSTTSQRASQNYNRYSSFDVSQSNTSNFQENSKSLVFEKAFNESLSITQEPNIQYEVVEHCLVVNSKDRDANAYPSSSSFQIQFQKEYRNISSIELIQAIVPNTNSVNLEPYLVLQIDEIDNVMDCNDAHISKAFAILGLHPSDGAFLYLDRCIHENIIKTYRQPKASLDRMTISVRGVDGTLFDFGTDSAPISKELQTTFIFRIKTMHKKMASLNHRNVF
jgi:hypothetical protein